jgi:actin-related protein
MRSDFSTELQKKASIRKHPVTVVTADGKTMKSEISRASFQCSEAYFRPSFIGLPIAGITQEIISVAELMDEELRREIFSRVLLSGGGSLIPGFVNRLQKFFFEWPMTHRPVVTAFEDRHLDPWFGGCAIAQSERHAKSCVSSQEYWESGSAVVTWKCL